MLCIMHLESLDDPLSPAERAYLLSNDPEEIEDAFEHDTEQEGLWSESALADAPSDPKLGEVDLGEARSWAMGAGQSSRALDYVRRHRPAPVRFSFDYELGKIREYEWDWLRVHNECDYAWNKTEKCPVHGAAITAGRRRQRAATLELREAVRIAVAHAADPSARRPQ